jgi:hypothetical protein
MKSFFHTLNVLNILNDKILNEWIY